MPAPVRLFLTGFGAFPGVEVNPTETLVRLLEEDPPDGLEVRAAVLPVSFRRVPAAWDAALAEAGEPDLLLALGVHPGASFRLERNAAAQLVDGRPDADGEPSGPAPLPGGDRATPLDLARLADALRAAGAPAVEISADAGGYVCARTYHHVLGRAAELRVPGLFLHVPTEEELPVADQARVVRAFLPALLDPPRES